ncbi:MAG TPA: sensor histidine kinase [Candidatus Portnoybacteria bacterium]|nr:sensor histidine kinase [Candidatus Portnoybacteria bacterium]
MENLAIKTLIQIIVLTINILGVWLISIVNSSSNVKHEESKLFELMVFFTFIWVDFAYFARIARPELGLLFVKIAWAITPLFFITIYLFFFSFFNKKVSYWISFPLLLLGTLNIPLVLFTPTIIHHIYFDSYHVLIINYGKMVWFFFAEVIIFTFLGYYLLLKEYVRSSIKERIKIIYILIGFSFFFLMNSVFNIICPVFLKIFHLYEFGDYSTIILLILIASAIVKHRLFGVKIILSEIFAGLSIIILLIDFLLSQSISEYIWKGILLIGFAIFSYLMIKAMIKEEKQREKLQRAHHQLESAYQKLERLDQAKSEFLSIATHQLRSPLTVTIDAISVILDGELGQLNLKQRKYLKEIFHRSRKMVEVVNNFLNLSRLELGRMKFNFQKTNLKELLEETIDNLACQEEAKKKGLKFIYYPSKKPLLPVVVDQFQVQQVMQNFITNAFHYTNQGEIKVKIYQKNHSVVFSVRDTGMGLTPDEKEVIFEKFRRGKRAQNQYTEGSGIGLYLATQIIKAHHGRLWVESKGENQGSTFYFSLPEMRNEN